MINAQHLDTVTETFSVLVFDIAMHRATRLLGEHTHRRNPHSSESLRTGICVDYLPVVIGRCTHMTYWFTHSFPFTYDKLGSNSHFTRIPSHSQWLVQWHPLALHFNHILCVVSLLWSEQLTLCYIYISV